MSKKAKVYVHAHFAGVLEEIEKGKKYRFYYLDTYAGEPVSLTMPLSQKIYEYDRFPPFFDGLLPEGFMLDALLRGQKIDRDDFMRQIIAVGHDMVGSVTIEDFNE